MASETQPTALPVAQIAIYSLLSVLVLFILIRHGKHGLLGWLYLFIFTSLRIVGNGLFLPDTATTGEAIIVSVGTSPLLLAAFGILSEARQYLIKPPLYHTVPLTLIVHIQISTGIALVATGSSSLTSLHPSTNASTLVKVGIAILFSAWLLICLLALGTWLQSRSQESNGTRESDNVTGVTYDKGKKILVSVLLALPLLGIRVLYSVAADFTQSATLNPVTGSLALRVVLSIVPEMLTTIIFVVGGLLTRNIARKF